MAKRVVAHLCGMIAILWPLSSAAADDNGQPSPLRFSPIQAQEFSVPGSLSNSWADFDNDGDADLAVSLKTGEVRLYRNDAGRFVSIGRRMGLPTSGPELRGLSWGDFDADGWLDLYGGATSISARNRLFRNRAGRSFAEAPAPLTEAGRSARQSSWVDYDNDGDLDLYAANRNGPNALFRQDAGGFRQVAKDEPVSDTRPTVGACWFDFDRDGDLDLFLANQAGATDAMWRNDAGRFTDIAAELGMDRPGRSKEDGSVGCALADYDNDGDLDLYVASYGSGALYKNGGDGRFVEVAASLGLDERMHAVGAAWGDYDNDGYVDLFVTAYEGPSGRQRPANRLYRNVGGLRFVNVLAADSPLNAGDHGVQWVDYDKDGALDLSITRGYTDQGGHFLFHNDLDEAKRHRSLAVQVLDRRGHFTCVGAEVRLFDVKGRLLATRQVTSGDGYNSQSALPVHFGLSVTGRVIVEVTFPRGPSRSRIARKRVDPTHFRGKVLRIRDERL